VLTLILYAFRGGRSGYPKISGRVIRVFKISGFENRYPKLSAFRPRGVPGPTSKLSLRVPAQMGRRETEHKGGKQ
jgi:hypothetical protein